MQTYLIKDGKRVIFKSFTQEIIILPSFFIAKIFFMQFLFLLTLPTNHNHQNEFFLFQQIPSYIYILKSVDHKSPPKLPRVWHVLRHSGDRLRPWTLLGQLHSAVSRSQSVRLDVHMKII